MAVGVDGLAKVRECLTSAHWHSQLDTIGTCMYCPKFKKRVDMAVLQADVLLSIRNAKFWTILGILSRIYALFGVLLQAQIVQWCKKLKNIR